MSLHKLSPSIRLTVFISSPGDVGQERLLATKVVERLQGQFGERVTLRPVLWEHEPLRATEHFQGQIPPPSQSDIVVCILWSRLGTRLPDNYQSQTGAAPPTGTEWEFEDAARAFRERGTPDLLVYRKTAEPLIALNDEEVVAERFRQKKALDAFLDRWFGNAEDSFKAAFHTFASPDQFENLLEMHLAKAVQERLPRHTTGPDEEASPAGWYRGSPYRGLQAFEVEHAPVFFGRTRAVGAVKDALVRQAAGGCAFVLVLGMSGCGKSSLVRAGVLPTLLQPGVVEGVGLARWCVFRPGDAAADLCAGLALALLGGTALPELAADGFDAREVAALFREAPLRAVAPVRLGLRRAAEAVAAREKLPRPPEARLAVVVDQLEELFTREPIGAAQRDQLLRFSSTIKLTCRGGRSEVEP